MVSATLLNQVVLVVAGLVLFGVAVRTYRMRDKPMASSFALLLSLLGLTAFCTGITATSGWPNKVIWLYTNLAIPIALVYFAFDYYGLDLFCSRERIAGISVPAVLGAIGGTVVILGTDLATTDGTAPIAMVAALPSGALELAGALNSFGYYYAAALILIGAGLVLQNVVQYEHLDTRLGVVIAFIGAWPWLGNFIVPEMKVAIGPVAALVTLSTGYSLSAVVATAVVGPLGLFRSSPAAGNVGPEMVLDSLHDAVVMVDDHDQILRLNSVACQTFERDEAQIIGRPVSSLLGRSADGLQSGGRVTLETTTGDREFEVTKSGVVDRTDSERGYVLVLRDVTDRLTREQRLEVLNRVLRHNLRNNATSILARAELISEDGARTADAEQIIDTTRSLVDTAERAREIESMMSAAGDRYETRLSMLVDRIVSDIQSDHPNVEITTAVSEDATAAVNGQVLETVLYNLAENAVVHNDSDDPIVVISAEQDSGSVTVGVSDNGPGIPDHELAVLDAGEEDQLEHGSGLGLWAVQWGITQMGGSLSVSENEPRGTTVSITLPTAVTGEASLPEQETVLA